MGWIQSALSVFADKRELLDPACFDDPLALQVDWTPLVRGGTNVCTQSGLQVIAGGQGACGPGRRDEGPGFEFSGALNGIEYGFESGACDSTVDNIVSELPELIEYNVFPVLGQIVACVVYFFDVTLGPTGADDVSLIRHPVF